MPYKDAEKRKMYCRSVYQKRMQDPTYRLYSSMRKKIWRRDSHDVFISWSRKYYKKNVTKIKKHQKAWRDGDSYARSLLKKETGLKSQDIPKGLVKLQVLKLKMCRKIKQTKKQDEISK